MRIESHAIFFSLGLLWKVPRRTPLDPTSQHTVSFHSTSFKPQRGASFFSNRPLDSRCPDTSVGGRLPRPCLSSQLTLPPIPQHANSFLRVSSWGHSHFWRAMPAGGVDDPQLTSPRQPNMLAAWGHIRKKGNFHKPHKCQHIAPRTLTSGNKHQGNNSAEG